MAGKRPEHGADQTLLPHQTWARMVMVGAAVTVVYFGGSNFMGHGGRGRTIMGECYKKTLFIVNVYNELRF